MRPKRMDMEPHTHTHAQAHIHTLTHARTQMHAHTPTNTHAPPPSHTHACTPTHRRALPHQHARTCACVHELAPRGERGILHLEHVDTLLQLLHLAGCLDAHARRQINLAIQRVGGHVCCSSKGGGWVW